MTIGDGAGSAASDLALWAGPVGAVPVLRERVDVVAPILTT
ncbi:hypothetical protein [Occultella gossypii]|nr:hypothetical protein [Occultella gossypii]